MQRTYFCGFSLIEALVVVAVLALIGAVATPSFTAFVERSRAIALADQLQAHLTFARATSVLRHRSVEVCGSSNGLDCDQAWHQGWVVRQVGNTEPLQSYRLAQRGWLRWNRGRSVVFQSNGASPASNGHFYICNDKSEMLWSLVLNNQGRVKRMAGMSGDEHCSSAK